MTEEITGAPKQQLRKYRELVSQLRSRMERLERVNREQRTMLRSLAGKCPTCGKMLKLMPWNSDVMILTCDNDRCKTYRQPQGEVRRKQVEKLMGGPVDKGD